MMRTEWSSCVFVFTFSIIFVCVSTATLQNISRNVLESSSSSVFLNQEVKQVLEHVPKEDTFFNVTLNRTKRRTKPFQTTAQSSRDVACPQPSCNPGQEAIKIDTARKSCPVHRCIPATKCEIDGSFIKTFDGLNLQYAICDHILAQEKNEWSISMQKICIPNSVCKTQLEITQGGHIIKINPDLSIEYDGFHYTTEQAALIGERTLDFSVALTGSDIFFESQLYGFWISMDDTGDIDIGVSSVLTNYVNGLCGKFNGIQGDDSTKPDGTFVKSSKVFGDSWERMSNVTKKCPDQTCSAEQRGQAFQICSSFTTKPSLSACAEVSSVDLSISSCIERTCNCLKYEKEDKCRCDSTLKYVKLCQAQDVNIVLNAWRKDFNCPVTCPPGLEYRDCYKRHCEPSCENVHDKNACPIVEEKCVSGCFCPETLVRKGANCVKPDECKNCLCWGWGDPHYTNFEGTKFDFQGECTFIASQDIGDEHKYQVLVSNSECIVAPKTSCTDAISVIFDDHVIHVRRVEGRNQILTYLDGDLITNFPIYNDWLVLETIPENQVTVLIPEIYLEVKYIYNLWKFELRLSSHLYSDNIEGLCGTCNKNNADDFKKSHGTLTTDINEFGLSWLVKYVPRGVIVDEKCKVPPRKVFEETKCLPGFPLPPNKDPCLWIKDVSKFGQCHMLVDPDSFIKPCQYDMCHGIDREALACMGVSAYALECQNHGLCLNWRTPNFCPYHCPEGKVYKACGSGCELTCDNHDKINKCSLDHTEGCFCPDGQVTRQGKCVPVLHCKRCDEQGHFVGDKWNTDKCKTCTCVAMGDVISVQCTNIDCDMQKKNCKKGYTAVLKKQSIEITCCPEFDCIEQACTIQGKHIKSFDGYLYQYVISNHILVQDIKRKEWKIILRVECSSKANCKKIIIVKQANHEIKIHSDFTVEYDEDTYTITQAQTIGLQTSEYKISNLGDAVLFESQLHGFLIVFDKQDTIKIMVSEALFDQINGLCGKYNGKPNDDTTKSNDIFTTIISEFGVSWLVKDSTLNVDLIQTKCSSLHQTIGKKLCSALVNKSPFNLCAHVIASDQFTSVCIDGMCACLPEQSEQYCLCDIATSYVKACKARAPDVDLSEWRVHSDCTPVSCPPGFIYTDCFKRRCEKSCANLHEKDPCPVLENTCNSGCFCADGLVRKGDKCVKPNECKDCVCIGNGDPHYWTFDKSYYDYQGKCTYVAARDVVSHEDEEHEFQVLVTNVECIVAPGTTCTHAVTVLYHNHVIYVRRVEDKKQIETKIDGMHVTNFPVNYDWLILEKTQETQVKILIPDIQLEVTYIYDSWTFSILLPSQMFPNNYEGLCGNCNQKKDDDFMTSDGQLATDIQTFAGSWLVKHLPPGIDVEDTCKGKVPKVPVSEPCKPPPVGKDPCSIIMDKNIFGLCHRLVDPAHYVKSCQFDACHGADAKTMACQSIAVYAGECQRHGLCLQWRTQNLCPHKCPQGFVYKACGSSCVRTCENYKQYKEDPNFCKLESSEGCFCPEGQVLKNEQCIGECECDSRELKRSECDTNDIPQSETIALIKEVKKRYGKCMNKKPIPGLKGCLGFCESASKYNSNLSTFVSEGNCCQPHTFTNITVEINCDNYTYFKTLQVPSSCLCISCPRNTPKKIKGT